MVFPIREIEEEKFQDEFYQKARKKKIPFKVFFELTYKCNLSCRHCYIIADPSRKELNFQEIRSVLGQLARIGCFYLAFTGGEIFCRPDILPILEYARNKGFHVTIFINGTLITPRIASFLKKININQVEISLYAMNEKTHGAITGVRGSFRRTLEGISLIRKQGIPLYLKMLVMNLNLSEFAAVKNFAKKLNIPFSYGYLIQPKMNGSGEPLLFRLSPKEAIELERRNRSFISEEKRNMQKPKKRAFLKQNTPFRCDAGRNFFAINPYGDMNICLTYPFPRYNIINGDVSRGWQEINKYVKSIRPEKNYQCNNCGLQKFCQWCPAEGLLERGDRNACVPYFKELGREEALANENPKHR